MKNSGIKHIFFDLDHTLWDFETNSKQTLLEIYEQFIADFQTCTFEEFYQTYKTVNEAYWSLYRKNQTTKTQLRTGRFHDTLKKFKINDEKLAETIATYYVTHSPRKTALFNGTRETLQQLSLKYQLHIITNGFEEVQHLKLQTCNLTPFFTQIITSEKAGVKKPLPDIFVYAMKVSGAQVHNSVMVGDSFEADIAGAANVGWKQIFFNPHRQETPFKPTAIIYSIPELLEIL